MLKIVLAGMMLVLASGFGLVVWMSVGGPAEIAAGQPGAPAASARSIVLAVSRPVAAGSLLTPEDIDKVELPTGELPPGTRPDTAAGRAELTGAMVRRNMAALQPLLTGDILRPGDGGFLAAVLAPGNRAVSIGVDNVSGTAGLIWPGDRVDLILTQVLDDQAAPAGRRTFGETVLRDVRVIAVDQQLARGSSPDTATTNMNNRTVTLEVLPDAAERVAVAVRLGRVALVVRAAQPAPAGERAAELAPGALTPGGWSDASSGVRSTPTWGQDVSPALIPRGTAGAAATVRVYQGATTDKEFKFE